jgi:ABC-2 type transport system ATP-binding protein
MEHTAIEVRDLHKSYGARPVLRGVSFEVGAGEVFGLAGRNGAGKTTTVEILQGLRSRDAGTVRVLGLDPARDRDRLRVGEALQLFAGLAGNVVDWRALGDAWALTPLLRKPCGTLSGGQRQRLFLALALVNDPRIVFLDELTQGLDPAARRETWQLVEQARDGGATVVLVTHDMDEAQRLCDRVAVVDGGTVLACGRPAEITGAAATVSVRFSAPGASALAGLERMPGVFELGYDGATADVVVEPRAIVQVAAELARRDVPADDFTVIRPSLEDAVVSLMNGGSR